MFANYVVMWGTDSSAEQSSVVQLSGTRDCETVRI